MSQFAKAINPPRTASRINSKMPRDIRFISDDAPTSFFSGFFLRVETPPSIPGKEGRLPLAAGFPHVIGFTDGDIATSRPVFQRYLRRCSLDFLEK